MSISSWNDSIARNCAVSAAHSVPQNCSVDAPLEISPHVSFMACKTPMWKFGNFCSDVSTDSGLLFRKWVHEFFGICARHRSNSVTHSLLSRYFCTISVSRAPPVAARREKITCVAVVSDERVSLISISASCERALPTSAPAAAVVDWSSNTQTGTSFAHKRSTRHLIIIAQPSLLLLLLLF